MKVTHDSPAVRKGQFLWMDENSRKTYLEALNRRISEGYYYSEKILSKVVEDLAPMMGEVAINDLTH